MSPSPGIGPLLDAFQDGLIDGLPRPEELSGHFLIVAYHEDSGELHAWTDRFGTLHAYHASDGRRAAIGTYSPAVAAAGSRRQLDWDGLTGFLGFGFFPGDRTFFDDVRILRPASHYVFDADGRHRRLRTLLGWWPTPDRSRSYDETVDEFASIFREVMGDLVGDGPVALPISGGLDSRSTLVPLGTDATPGIGQESGAIPTGIPRTRSKRESPAASPLRRGLPFRAMVVRPYLFDHIDEILNAVEGFQDLTQCRQASVAEEIGQHADRVIAAHCGDVWLDDAGMVGVRGVVDEDELLGHALKKCRKRGRGWLLEQICRPRLEGREPKGCSPTYYVPS